MDGARQERTGLVGVGFWQQDDWALRNRCPHDDGGWWQDQLQVQGQRFFLQVEQEREPVRPEGCHSD